MWNKDTLAKGNSAMRGNKTAVLFMAGGILEVEAQWSRGEKLTK